VFFLPLESTACSKVISICFMLLRIEISHIATSFGVSSSFRVYFCSKLISICFMHLRIESCHFATSFSVEMFFSSFFGVYCV